MSTDAAAAVEISTTALLMILLVDAVMFFLMDFALAEGDFNCGGDGDGEPRGKYSIS